MTSTDSEHVKRVRQFRQILLWPLQLMPIRAGSQIQQHWEVLQAAGAQNPWHEVVDEFTGDPALFQERHYNELVTFLPYVQRFLYGEGRPSRSDGASSEARQGDDPRSSPMRVFRREDVAAVRAVARPGDTPLALSIAHIDLYFFYDIDVVLLNVEVCAADLPLAVAQDTLYRFGRAYPAAWDENGQAINSMASVEWLAADGRVLAASDAGERGKFLAFVCQHRAPGIAAHWAFLLQPLALDHTEQQGPIRYRQLEYYRMPVMAYLAMDDPRALTRNDFIRLGLVTEGGDRQLSYSERQVADFDDRYCYDRFWSESGEARPETGGASSADRDTRYLCCGHALVVVGAARAAFFVNAETGVLGQFRHQHFLLFLIAHFQKAALLMFSDRLVDALKQLDIGDPESVKRFKRAIRELFEIFLRFTHRYWFHEISEQAQTKALFRLCATHLGLDSLYAEVKERIHDMDEYLDSDSLRRQANTVVRLTVVTTFGMIGTITTGFLGMNLIAAADQPFAIKLFYFALVLVVTIWLTAFTVVRSKRLSDLLDALSDERMPAKAKLAALLGVLRRRPPDG